MTSHSVLIGLGSNTSAVTELAAAYTALEQLFGTVRRSAPLRTAPLDGYGPDYLNAVALLQTALPPGAVRVALKTIERIIGRTPQRDTIPIDLDLLAYGTERSLRRNDLLEHPFYGAPARKLLEQYAPQELAAIFP